MLNLFGNVLFNLSYSWQRLHKFPNQNDVVNQPNIESITSHINIHHIGCTLFNEIFADFNFDPHFLANILKQTCWHESLLVTIQLLALCIKFHNKVQIINLMTILEVWWR